MTDSSGNAHSELSRFLLDTPHSPNVINYFAVPNSPKLYLNSVLFYDKNSNVASPDFIESCCGRAVRFYGVKEDAASVADEVNAFSARESQGKIPVMVSPEDYQFSEDEAHAFSLVSAVAFNDEWLTPFTGESGEKRRYLFYTYGRDGAFHSKKIDFLTSSRTVMYSENSRFRSIALPFKDSRYEIEFFIPNCAYSESMDSYIAQLRALTPNDIETLRRTRELSTVKIAIPIMKLNSTFDFAAHADSLALSAIFDTTQHNFPHFFNPQALVQSSYLKKATQKASLELDETGVRASAITLFLSSMTLGGASESFHLAFPFIYTITHRSPETGVVTPIFMGYFNGEQVVSSTLFTTTFMLIALALFVCLVIITGCRLRSSCKLSLSLFRLLCVTLWSAFLFAGIFSALYWLVSFESLHNLDWYAYESFVGPVIFLCALLLSLFALRCYRVACGFYNAFLIIAAQMAPVLLLGELLLYFSTHDSNDYVPFFVAQFALALIYILFASDRRVIQSILYFGLQFLLFVVDWIISLWILRHISDSFSCGACLSDFFIFGFPLLCVAICVFIVILSTRNIGHRPANNFPSKGGLVMKKFWGMLVLILAMVAVLAFCVMRSNLFSETQTCCGSKCTSHSSEVAKLDSTRLREVIADAVVHNNLEALKVVFPEDLAVLDAIEFAPHHTDILSLAARHADTPLIDFLISRGVRYNEIDIAFLPDPFDCAAKRGNWPVLEYLLDRFQIQKDSPEMLSAFYSASHNQKAIILKLVARGMDLNTTLPMAHCGLLVHAVENGDTEWVHYLVEHGINLDYRYGYEGNNFNAVTTAIALGHFELAEYLLSKGAKWDTTTAFGENGYDAVLRLNGSVEACRYFWEKGVRVLPATFDKIQKYPQSYSKTDSEVLNFIVLGTGLVNIGIGVSPKESPQEK